MSIMRTNQVMSAECSENVKHCKNVKNNNERY